jgi:protein-S-isoprenylcysteine O-methyltransferase Ste14
VPPRGVFGLPHGVLSSPAEWVALGIGVVAVFVALVLLFVQGREAHGRALAWSGAGGILVALVGSVAGRPAVTDEWHIPVGVVLVVGGGVAWFRRRERKRQRGRGHEPERGQQRGHEAEPEREGKEEPKRERKEESEREGKEEPEREATEEPEREATEEPERRRE